MTRAAIQSLPSDHMLPRVSRLNIDGDRPLFQPSLLMQAMDTLRRELDELRRRERAQKTTIDRLQEELRAAAAVQESLLRGHIPVLNGIAVNVVHEPFADVSGDSYDVIRLDEHRTAFVLADATGHGMSSALLTTYVHRAIREACADRHINSVFDPRAVLQRVNREVVDARLPDCQFVAAIYAVHDSRTRTVRWVRAGVPYPVLVRRGGSARSIESRGTILGATDECELEVAEVRLGAGDALLFFTDGVEPSEPDGGETVGGTANKLAPWMNHLSHRPTATSWEVWCRRYLADAVGSRCHDDVTIMTLEAESVSPLSYPAKLNTVSVAESLR